MAATLDTITSPMSAVFTPPSSCTTHWTYESEAANSVRSGLLVQDALFDQQDTRYLPLGFAGWGRAPSFIQVSSPGACSVGYTTAIQNYNAEITTAFLSFVSGINDHNPRITAQFYGCTSVYNGGVTEVFAAESGSLSAIDGTTTGVTAVSGPITMWAQPITVAFQESDLALFTSSSIAASQIPARSSSSSPSHSNKGPSFQHPQSTNSNGGSTPSSSPSSSPAPTPSPGLSAGPIAGIAIGAAIFFRRKQKGRRSFEASREPQVHQQATVPKHYPQQSGLYTNAPNPDYAYPKYQRNAMEPGYPHGWGMSELSNHADRREELPTERG